MPLFEVAILEHPSKKDVEEGKTLERLAMSPTLVVAKDDKSAALRAVMEMPKEKSDQLDKDRMQVLVRPFA